MVPLSFWAFLTNYREPPGRGQQPGSLATLENVDVLPQDGTGAEGEACPGTGGNGEEEEALV